MPRWTSAIWSSVADAGVKSAGSQPALDELGVGPGGTWLSSAGMMSPVTSPLPENWKLSVSYSSPSTVSVGSASFWKNGNSNSCSTTL